MFVSTFSFLPTITIFLPKRWLIWEEQEGGWEKESVLSVSPSIHQSYFTALCGRKGAKMQRVSVKERLKRLEAQREEMRKAEPPVIHVIIIHVLDDQSFFGRKGEYLRLFLDEAGYKKAREEETARHIEIIRYSRVKDRYLVSWGRERAREI